MTLTKNSAEKTVSPIRPIRTEADYQAALAEVERLFGANPDSPEGERFEVLATLVESYEKQHYPIEPPTAVGAIKHYMEARGLTSTDMQRYIGPKGRVSEVLNGKRGLTINMIRRLLTLGIPADILLRAHDEREEQKEAVKRFGISTASNRAQQIVELARIHKSSSTNSAIGKGAVYNNARPVARKSGIQNKVGKIAKSKPGPGKR